jgi:acyl carrier protein
MEHMMPDPTAQTPQEAHLAHLIVKTLNLDIKADEIDPLMPLFSEGLGLDSIDILEIALAVSQDYGVKLRSDDENNATIFQSLRSLNDDIQRRRAS